MTGPESGREPVSWYFRALFGGDRRLSFGQGMLVLRLEKEAKMADIFNAITAEESRERDRKHVGVLLGSMETHLNIAVLMCVTVAKSWPKKLTPQERVVLKKIARHVEKIGLITKKERKL